MKFIAPTVSLCVASVRATAQVNGRPHFRTPTNRKALNRSGQNLSSVIMSATRPFTPNLVIIGAVGACPHIGEVVNPCVYFLVFDLLAHLPRPHRSSINVVNGLKHVLP